MLCALQFRQVADTFSKSKRSQIMAAVRSRGNKETEAKLAGLLRSHRITGWRRHPNLPGNPDFVFPRQRLALFVDGCFWHGCRKHCRMPATNCNYWRAKISRNVARDKVTARALRNAGWRVIRLWSHALRKPRAVINRINKELSEIL
jgi:DNA mismatch endonuclease (patch repair protein)